jgi:hypothetical protein
MKKAVLSLLVCVVILTADPPGIRPRADVGNYAAHSENADFSIGVVLLLPEQVKKMFKADLNHGYVVIEVGVFPRPGKDVDLYPSDFTLSVSEKSTALRPVSADTIAEVLAGKQQPPRVSGSHDVNTSGGVSIGRASYPDPVTGRRRTETVTEADVGVGIGEPAGRPCRGYDCDSTSPTAPTSQGSPTQTANVISQDLWEKSLPDGKIVHPVAGYLYFPKPSRKAKDTNWELRHENADGKTRLPLR